MSLKKVWDAIEVYKEDMEALGKPKHIAVENLSTILKELLKDLEAEG